MPAWRVWLAWPAALLGALLAAACYGPDIADCAIRCNEDSGCPDGFSCSAAGRCTSSGDACTSGPGGDDGGDDTGDDTDGGSAGDDESDDSSDGAGGDGECESVDEPECERCRSLEKLSAGFWFNCATDTDGAVWCWGQNLEGELGFPPSAGSECPVSPQGLTAAGTVTAVADGSWHTCALVGDGDVWCWGKNVDYQLGREEQDPAPAATSVSYADQLAIGTDHTCSHDPTGLVYCWGADENGQLGDGLPSAPRAAPMVVMPDVDVLGSGSRHVCARTTDGTLWCWGHNMFGQLGTGSALPAREIDPVEATLTADFAADIQEIAAGDYHTCARTTSDVYCWGRNANGQLGVGDEVNRLEPTRALLPPGAAPLEIDAGTYHTCALLDTGRVYCWGENDYGQVDGSPPIDRPDLNNRNALEPVAVPGVCSATALATGVEHTCALAERGLLCWGDPTTGVLGRSPAEWADRPFPGGPLVAWLTCPAP